MVIVQLLVLVDVVLGLYQIANVPDAFRVGTLEAYDHGPSSIPGFIVDCLTYGRRAVILQTYAGCSDFG